MFEYNGGVYPGTWVYDGSGAQVVGVRLYLTPGVLSDPIPLSQVRLVGSTVGGIINSTMPPLNPPPGTIWLNSGVSTQNGIPPQSYGYWNGTTWVLMGSGAPQTPLSGQTPPTSPTNGTIWYNSGTNTTNGIPPGGYGYWNGSAWVLLGTSQPQLGSGGSGVAGVQSVNNLSGAVTIAEGSGIDITQAGNTITVTATGVSGGTPGVTSVNGLTGGLTLVGAGGTTITPSGSNITITAPAPSAAVSSFNGRSGAVVPVASDYTPAFIGAATGADISAAIAAHNGATDPHAQYQTAPETYGSDYVAAASAPTGATTGQIWKNTSGSTVSGVAAGNFGVRTPAGTWFDAGPRYPFLVPGNANPSILSPGAPNTYLSTNASGTVGWTPLIEKDSNPGFVAQYTAAAPYVLPQAQAIPSNIFFFHPGPELTDTANCYNPTTGLITIPSGLKGVWKFEVSIVPTYTGLSGVSFCWAYLSVNNATTLTQFINGSPHIATGGVALPVNAGDVIRYWVCAYPFGSYSTYEPIAAPSNASITSVCSATLLYPLP